MVVRSAQEAQRQQSPGAVRPAAVEAFEEARTLPPAGEAPTLPPSPAATHAAAAVECSFQQVAQPRCLCSPSTPSLLQVVTLKTGSAQ